MQAFWTQHLQNARGGRARLLSPNSRNFVYSLGVKSNSLRPQHKLVCSLKGMAVLEAIALAKFYGSVPAVREVTFRLEPGQVLGYLGPNGSGKSTTVKVLTGLLQPTRGQVLFEGQDVQKDLVSYRKRLGYVPEEANLYPFLTGEEYLEMIGTLRAMSPVRMKSKIASLLELFSLFPHRHVSLGSYSKGMRQRILLIAALMDNPDVLILDEPLSGLDVTSVLIIKSLIQTFSVRGKAVFYCSHILEVVEKVCSQLLILRRRQVMAYGSTEDVRRQIGRSSLEHIFLQLVEDKDVAQVASEIVDVVVSPS
jgi:ABC-2 type transport system ATP-binding protein